MSITHTQFTQAFQTEMRGNFHANANQETIILGAISLFWEHSKNIDYLNSAMQYARSRSGIRVNAVRAFLLEFTGAVYTKKDGFRKGGKKEALPAKFHDIRSWLDWANDNAQEPEYNLAKQQLKVVAMLQKEKRIAEKAGEGEMVNMLDSTIVDYVEAQRQAVVAS